MTRSRRKHQEEHGGGGMERWLLTYADLITLLMAFFVIMYAMSNVDANKYAALAESLRSAFGTEGAGILPDAKSPQQKQGKGMSKDKAKAGTAAAMPSLKELKNMRDAKEEKQLAAMVEKINEYAKANGIGGLQVKEDGRGIVINLSDKILFESGKADLSPSAKAVLDGLAGILFTSGKHIKVEGHTDNIPINNGKYASNWQLSTDRATNVIMHWSSRYRVPSAQLSAAGYGEFRPVATNDSLEGRAKNRRVDIVVLRDLMSLGEPEIPAPKGEKAPIVIEEELPEELKK